MHTGRRKRRIVYDRRKSNKRHIFIMCLLLLLIVFILLIWNIGFSRYNYNFSSLNKYVIEDIYTDEAAFNGLAQDIAVTEGDKISIEGFDFGSGILAPVDGGEAIYSKSPFERIYPASTTKIMTCILVLKYCNLNDTVIAGDECLIDEEGASMAGIKPGDSMSVEQLLYCLMLPSGNDAAAVLAKHVSGSMEEFSKLMTKHAKYIGAVHTNFVNPHGLHDTNHYTTAYDMYLIMREALKYDKFREITTSRNFELKYKDINGVEQVRTITNGNRFLSGGASLPEGYELTGGKTGTTLSAKNCLVLSERNINNNREYISIIFKDKTKQGLYDDMSKLIENSE